MILIVEHVSRLKKYGIISLRSETHLHRHCERSEAIQRF